MLFLGFILKTWDPVIFKEKKVFLTTKNNLSSQTRIFLFRIIFSDEIISILIFQLFKNFLFLNLIFMKFLKSSFLENQYQITWMKTFKKWEFMDTLKKLIFQTREESHFRNLDFTLYLFRNRESKAAERKFLRKLKICLLDAKPSFNLEESNSYHFPCIVLH